MLPPALPKVDFPFSIRGRPRTAYRRERAGPAAGGGEWLGRDVAGEDRAESARPGTDRSRRPQRPPTSPECRHAHPDRVRRGKDRPAGTRRAALRRTPVSLGNDDITDRAHAILSLLAGAQFNVELERREPEREQRHRRRRRVRDDCGGQARHGRRTILTGSPSLVSIRRTADATSSRGSTSVIDREKSSRPPSASRTSCATWWPSEP